MNKIIASILILFIISACNVLQTIQDLPALKFRIASADEYRIQDVSLNNKKSLKDFTALEMLKLTSGFMKGNLLLTFIINVEVKNNNIGENQFSQSDISIRQFPYRLLLNDKEILQGDIDKPFYIPGRGKSALLPLKVEFNVVKSYKEKSLEDILSFLLQLGGVNGSTSNIKLKVQPTLGTTIGNIRYPSELTIVDKTFD